VIGGRDGEQLDLDFIINSQPLVGLWREFVITLIAVNLPRKESSSEASKILKTYNCTFNNEQKQFKLTI
jgi:hypothetical protein